MLYSARLALYNGYWKGKNLVSCYNNDVLAYIMYALMEAILFCENDMGG